MSQETSLWLNTNTLIGFTDKRGFAWHYRAEEQGEQSNHYPLAIPVADVQDRLFHWKALEGDVTSHAITPEGVLTVTDPTRKTIIRPDTQEILGIFKQGYKIHDYEKWLLETVAEILDDDLSIGSAGLLRAGAVAWVSVEVPDTITTPEGVTFRPHLLAVTSLDGSIATTFKRVATNTVCDNTMRVGLSEKGQQLKIRHSRNSEVKLAEARGALELVHTIADEFAAEVAQLCNTKVSEGDWNKFLDELVPTTDEDGEAKDGRGLTIATNKRDTLTRLWTADARVAPWRHTAWGVVQAVNTAVHHEFTVQGERAERNMLRSIEGEFDRLDANTMKTLNAVLAA